MTQAANASGPATLPYCTPYDIALYELALPVVQFRTLEFAKS